MRVAYLYFMTDEPQRIATVAPAHAAYWRDQAPLGEITAPTLVMAGRDDFLFPPECQRELAAGIPHARLQLIDRAGHNPHDSRPPRS
jgi:pimeloyl-ACP methyl ester carboxylesterase